MTHSDRNSCAFTDSHIRIVCVNLVPSSSPLSHTVLLSHYTQLPYQLPTSSFATTHITPVTPSLNMAAEPASAPVNGNYGTHQQYSVAEPNLSSQAPNHADAVAPATGAFGAQNANVPSSSGSTTSAANEGNSSVPKDEVGWYFVEQYYTTLSRNPEKLHVSP